MDETDAVRARYAKRVHDDPRYRLSNPAALLAFQDRQRVLMRLLADVGLHDLASPMLLEVGCGGGGNLLELMRLGFDPAKLSGVELLHERYVVARECLPPAVRLWQGDASALEIPEASLDIVLQSTVFSSLLDDAFQQRLADAMWRWLKPGGAVLWYDFAFDNPRNPDVRGVPLARVRDLFPQGRITARRVTLAPPLARPLVRLHPGLYAIFNAVPWLRTHRWCWVGKR